MKIIMQPLAGDVNMEHDGDMTNQESYELIADERLDIAEYVITRLLRHLKGKRLTGLGLEQMKHIEQAAQHIEIARLKGR